MADGMSSLSNLLFAAICQNDLFALKRLCATSPKAVNVLLKQRDSSGVSALLCSTANGHFQISSFLLELGADVNASNDYGWTPLMTAAFHRRVDHIRNFLTLPYIDIDAANLFGHTALMIAVAGGHLDIVYSLLNAGARPNYRGSQSSSDGLTPLMLACFKGDFQMVSALLKPGAEINAQNKINMWTPLMYTASRKDTETSAAVAHLLLEYGADVKAKNQLGLTCVDIAAVCENEAFMDALNVPTDSSSQQSSLRAESKRRQVRHIIFDAIGSRNRPLLLSMISYDISCIDTLDSGTGLTPLMYATIEDELAIAKILLDCGANIDAANPVTGWTALMYAIYYQRVEGFKLLLDRGADPYVVGKDLDNSQMTRSMKSPGIPRELAAFSARDLATLIGDTAILGLLETSSASSSTVVKKSSGSLSVMSKWHSFRKVKGVLPKRSATKQESDHNIISQQEKSKFKLQASRKRNSISVQSPVNAPDRTNAFYTPLFDSDAVESSLLSCQTSNVDLRDERSHLTLPRRLPIHQAASFSPTLPTIQNEKLSLKTPESLQELLARWCLDDDQLQKYWRIFSLRHTSIDDIINISRAEELKDLGFHDPTDRKDILMLILRTREEIATAQVEGMRRQLESF